MKLRVKSIVLCVLALCLISGLFVPVRAQETTNETTGEAADISGRKIVTDSEGFSSINALFDGKLLEGKASKESASLTLEYESGIGSLYFLFDKIGGSYTITDNNSGEIRTAGENGFLHDFVDLEALFGTAPSSVTVSFSSSVTIFELYVYTSGGVPDTVQKWEIPADGNTDLVLFSTHGDDEQLFFAGVLPYYAGELGYQVQVVYLTDHRKDDPHRIHEMLNGLWTVGVTAYPVMPPFPDFFVRYDIKATYAKYEAKGYTREELLDYVVEQLRRFKPLVAVGHDVNGEYGHGMHMVYADLLMEAVTIADDPAFYPESADQYGLWDTPKTYLHMYEENQIVMAWNQPLTNFDGMTAYEVTRDLGYPCHESQYRDFAWYFRGAATAMEVTKYNPCYYGLYRSTVGDDVEKNDFFENIITHEELKRIEEEQRLAAEEARRQEEEARLAEEQRRREEEARQASEAAAQEEAARQESIAQAEADRLAGEARQRRNEMVFLAAVMVILLFLLFVLLFLRGRKRRKRKRR